MNAQEIIQISTHQSMDACAQAYEIAKVFYDEKMVYIPRGEFFSPFLRMISAIWCGGYIAGVQAERARRNRSRAVKK